MQLDQRHHLVTSLWGSEQRKDSYQVNLGTKDTDWWGRGGAGGGCMLVLQGNIFTIDQCIYFLSRTGYKTPKSTG